MIINAAGRASMKMLSVHKAIEENPTNSSVLAATPRASNRAPIAFPIPLIPTAIALKSPAFSLASSNWLER
ncbi:hypothetical protein D9M69_659500 [compost metagenome]